ncbi:MAG: malto-oligosyltrehalose trehalohydrolase [Planctomycetaceae bacterium]
MERADSNEPILKSDTTMTTTSPAASRTVFRRRLPVSAEVQPRGGVHFRVWAPRRDLVEVVVGPGAVRQPLELEGAEGYHSGFVANAKAGYRYHFLLDGGEYAYPDPASRFQPEGVHGPSEIVDPSAYQWSDAGWKGISLKGQVISEIHLGTFTTEGTYTAAADKLPLLKETGVTVVELMPLAEYAGEYGWGYDGVDFYAPTKNHGTPDDLRRFVDTAHRLGMAVILDVVYNHFGPEGNYASAFSDQYFSKEHEGEWGDPINFDGESSQPVREYMIENAGYWIDEFHFDGLRLDAVHAIIDDSPDHVLAALTRRAREKAAQRRIVIINEDEFQIVKHFTPTSEGGYGLDGGWNDDFHHACRVAATGHAEAYYAGYQGSPQEIASAVRHGYLYQGQWHAGQKKFRGSSTRGRSGRQFVTFLQNHDQVANDATGLRLHQQTSAGRYRALTAVWLLAPGTPLFFQGQEWAASAPFHYFVDHPVDLGMLVREGRWNEMRRFNRAVGREKIVPLFDPTDRDVYEACKIDWNERERGNHAETLAMHRDLLRMRREDPTFAAQNADAIDSAVLGPEAFLLRYFGPQDDDRLIFVNLGRDLGMLPAAEPLFAAPGGKKWKILWSSDDPRYGGTGTASLDLREWIIPGHATLALAPFRPNTEPAPQDARTN